MSRQSDYRERERRDRNEIGELPAVVDSERRASCESDLKLFCETYFSELFYLKFSEVHETLIAGIQDTVLKGKIAAVALPRGSGKSTISQVAIIWALLYGHRKYAALIASEATRAQQLLQDIRVMFETNDVLCEDFPEACIPLRRLENISIKAKSQTYRGELTRITVNANTLVLPTIPGSKSSAARIFATGLTSSNLRGSGAMTPDGQKIRPDICLVDDPSTAESAKSEEQNNTRERLLKADVLGMAGPGKKLATLITMTVIAENDLAMRLLDNKRNPDFHGYCVPLLPSFPSNMELWKDYNAIRVESPEDATRFYSEHRDAMDAGAVTTWTERFNEDEISSVQNAMNLFFRDEASFNTEYQNRPAETKEDVLKIANTTVKLSWLQSDFLEEEPYIAFKTAAIDVHKDLLYWSVCGWSNDFRGQVLAFGAYPEQSRRIFTKSEAHPKLDGSDGVLQAAIVDCISYLRQIANPQLIGVDIGYQQSLIQECLRLSGQRTYGMKGVYYGAKSQRQMSDFKPSSTLTVGNHWTLKKDGRNASKTIFVDTNYWKTRVYQNFDKRLLKVNGSENDVVQLSNHLKAEKAVLVSTANSSCYEWECAKGVDNHLLDTLVYNHVLASCGGARAEYDAQDTRRARRSMYREATK